MLNAAFIVLGIAVLLGGVLAVLHLREGAAPPPLPFGALHGLIAIAGPVGAVVGTAVGGVIGGVEGVLGVDQRYYVSEPAPVYRHHWRRHHHRRHY